MCTSEGRVSVGGVSGSSSRGRVLLWVNDLVDDLLDFVHVD